MSRIYDRPAATSLHTDAGGVKGESLRMAEELDEIALHCAALLVLDRRHANEIMGYGENGLPL
jgi:hypothetical protein